MVVLNIEFILLCNATSKFQCPIRKNRVGFMLKFEHLLNINAFMLYIPNHFVTFLYLFSAQVVIFSCIMRAYI